jgi:hypothetical protein
MNLKFNGGTLFIPFFSGLTWTEAEIFLFVAEQWQVESAQLPQNERDHVRRFPITSMEEMRQGVCRKISETFWTVKRVI